VAQCTVLEFSILQPNGIYPARIEGLSGRTEREPHNFLPPFNWLIVESAKYRRLPDVSGSLLICALCRNPARRHVLLF
jgi:hypothetical protein